MGKRYYCDYCDKTMSSTPSIIRTHNQGLVHQKLVQDHYQQFKDPETILSEEATKKPCLRFAKGECQFGSICRFSHYTRQQLDWLRNYVTSKTKKPHNFEQPSFTDLYSQIQSQRNIDSTDENTENTTLYDSNGVTHVLPWVYNTEYEDKDLPVSLRRYTVEDFYNASIAEWG